MPKPIIHKGDNPTSPDACEKHHLPIIDAQTEILEDLQCAGLQVIQKKEGFKFGMDSVLLANFVKTDKNASIVELCSGSGVISILMTAKTEARRIVGVELQDWFVEMANRSIQVNHLESSVGFVCADLRRIPSQPLPGLGAGSADTVVVNPPYLKQHAGILSTEASVAIAKHEICCTLQEVVAAAAFLLKSGGNLFMVHRPDRLADVFCALRAFHIEPRYVKSVHASYGKHPVLFLICGKKHARANLKFLEPLYTYDLSGNYLTQEMLQTLNREIR